MSFVTYTYFPSQDGEGFDISRKVFDGLDVIGVIVAKNVDMSHILGKMHQGILKDAFDKELMKGLDDG